MTYFLVYLALSVPAALFVWCALIVGARSDRAHDAEPFRPHDLEGRHP